MTSRTALYPGRSYSSAIAGKEQRLDYRVVSAIDDLDALAKAWSDLHARSRGRCLQFLTFAWCRQWAEHFLADCDTKRGLYVLVGHEAGRPVAIWPLTCQYRLGLRVMKLAGEPVSQYGDILVADTACCEAWIRDGLDFLFREAGVDVLRFEGLHEAGALAPALRSFGFAPVASRTGSWLDLKPLTSGEDFRARSSKKTRRTRRRQRTLLEQDGPLCLRTHRSGPEARTAIAKALRFKADWLERKGLVSRSLSDDRTAEFWYSLAEAPGGETGLFVSEFLCGSTTLAVEAALRHGGSHIAHIGAFNPDYERYSPGALQMEATIANCIEAGLEAYDLLPPTDSYKSRWTDHSAAVDDFIIAGTVSGKVYAQARKGSLYAVAKRVYLSLPLRLRQFTAGLIRRAVPAK